MTPLPLADLPLGVCCCDSSPTGPRSSSKSLHSPNSSSSGMSSNSAMAFCRAYSSAYASSSSSSSSAGASSVSLGSSRIVGVRPKMEEEGVGGGERVSSRDGAIMEPPTYRPTLLPTRWGHAYLDQKKTRLPMRTILCNRT